MGLMTLNIVTIKIMTRSVMTLSIKACSNLEIKSRMTLIITLRTKILSIFMLSITLNIITLRIRHSA